MAAFRMTIADNPLCVRYQKETGKTISFGSLFDSEEEPCLVSKIERQLKNKAFLINKWRFVFTLKILYFKYVFIGGTPKYRFRIYRIRNRCPTYRMTYFIECQKHRKPILTNVKNFENLFYRILKMTVFLSFSLLN